LEENTNRQNHEDRDELPEELGPRLGDAGRRRMSRQEKTTRRTWYYDWARRPRGHIDGRRYQTTLGEKRRLPKKPISSGVFLSGKNKEPPEQTERGGTRGGVCANTTNCYHCRTTKKRGRRGG